MNSSDKEMVICLVVKNLVIKANEGKNQVSKVKAYYRREGCW